VAQMNNATTNKKTMLVPTTTNPTMLLTVKMIIALITILLVLLPKKSTSPLLPSPSVLLSLTKNCYVSVLNFNIFYSKYQELKELLKIIIPL
jgi:hypothetical protein